MALRVPKVSFEGPAAAARGYAGIARSLDSMSSYFLQMSEQKAQIEGAEYGAMNAPTQKQIDEAYQRGEEIELPGDQSSVYGRAVRKAALSVASDEITALANTRMTEVAGIFDTVLTNPNLSQETLDLYKQQLGIQDFSPQSFGLVMDTIIAGYGSTLDNTSPALARSFRAQQAIVANNKWSSYLEAYVKEENAKLETSFRNNHNETFTVSTIADLITSKNGEDLITRARQSQTQKSVSFLSGSEIKNFQDGMDDVEKGAALQVLTDGAFSADDPVDVIKKVQGNNLSGLSDGMQLAVKMLKSQGMSNTDIAQELRKRRSEIINFEENEEQNRDGVAQETENGAIGAAMRAMLVGDTEAFEVQIAIIDQTNPEKAAELTTKYTEAGERRTQSDPDSVAFLNNLGTNISFGDVAEHFDMLSNKDRKFYSEQAQKYEDDEYQAAANWLRGAMEIPVDIQTIAKDDKNYARYQLFGRLKGELELRLTQARKEGRNFDALAEAKTLLEENDVEMTGKLNQMTLDTGNQIITAFNNAGTDDFPIDLTEGDFNGAIFFIDGLLSMKKKNRPSKLRVYNDGQLKGWKKKLEEARDVAQ
tara:strand:- start:2340 stop:4112 length:1773 start_codon:yes stop_codon:yes gene_type:complete